MNVGYMRIVGLLFSLLSLMPMAVSAQRADMSKLSSLLRRVVRAQSSEGRYRATATAADGRTVCSFVRTTGDGEAFLEENGCRILARFGDICIADVPLCRLVELTTDARVLRIEAGRGTHALLDSVPMQLDVPPVYAGTDLPQAFTGEGVVMGLMDIGFDLTHPNFYDDSGTEYRIKRLWDFLSVDTIDSELYVGAEYTTQEALLAYGCSRNGLRETHGTHTLGIAAGSGYGSEYRGIAYESDICLVSNAVSDDEELIGEDDLYKYTYATDALGFKYIFDYAERQGQPCVISFSEGSLQDFRGDDVLYYDVLSRLVGPGRIIVSSAGNTGHVNNYLHKPAGTESDGAFLYYWQDYVAFTAVSDGDFCLRIVVYGDTNDTLTIASQSIAALTDSVFTQWQYLLGRKYTVTAEAYTSCYDSARTAFDVCIEGPWGIGGSTPLSVEVVGEEADVECYRVNGTMEANALNPELSGGDNSHGVHSPSTAPALICVGATAYRTAFENYADEVQTFDCGSDGVLATISSRGPTFDEREKPDVLAPGINIISSMSSYYMEENPDDLADLVTSFTFGDRTYGWAGNSGTSMSSPAVGGIIALWLEADPTLSPDDILGVLERTCTKPDGMTEERDLDHGYGQIDAYRGLLDILDTDAIEGLSSYQPAALSFSLRADATLIVTTSEPLVSPVALSIYSVDGMLWQQTTLEGGATEYHVSLATLPHGVYAVQARSAQALVTGSTLIRL